MEYVRKSCQQALMMAAITLVGCGANCVQTRQNPDTGGHKSPLAQHALTIHISPNARVIVPENDDIYYVGPPRADVFGVRRVDEQSRFVRLAFASRSLGRKLQSELLESLWAGDPPRECVMLEVAKDCQWSASRVLWTAGLTDGVVGLEASQAPDLWIHWNQRVSLFPAIAVDVTAGLAGPAQCRVRIGDGPWSEMFEYPANDLREAHARLVARFPMNVEPTAGDGFLIAQYGENQVAFRYGDQVSDDVDRLREALFRIADIKIQQPKGILIPVKK